MLEKERVLELVGGYCDLEERLALVPPSARVRGLFIRTVGAGLQKAGKSEAYRALFDQTRFSPLRFYPVTDYLVHLAAGGALLAGPEHVHQGMREVSRGNAVAFSESLLGRTLLRALSPDPSALLRQGAAGKRQGTTYGRWDVAFPAPRQATVGFVEEYVWIESSLLGAAQGMFALAGIEPEIDVRLQDRLNGEFRIRW